MSRRLLLTGRGLVTGLALAVLAAGCGVGPERQARPLTSEEAPFALLSRPTGAAQPPGERSEQLLFIEDALLVPVSRRTVLVTPQSALSDLLTGPSVEERARGLTTALPAGAGPGQVRVEDGLASVSLGGELLDSGRSDQLLAFAQVVLTLAALPEVTAVRFLRDGQPLPVPRADGAIVEAPLTAADYRSLVAPG